MAKFTVRVTDGELVYELANVYFTNADGIPTIPLTGGVTDEEGYASIIGNGDFITASYGTRKATVKNSQEEFIYIDLGADEKNEFPELVILSKKDNYKPNYLPIVILFIAVSFATALILYAIKKRM